MAAQLARRFELDAVVITAPAGYGKTTALAQVLATANDDDRVDIWLQCTAADEDADVLGAALLRACGLDHATSAHEARSVGAEEITDALLRLAPAHACLVVDDFHVLSAGSSGLALLGDVVARLPRNGHVVLCGRANPGLPLGRMVSRGVAEQLTAADLAYDDDELDRAAGFTTDASQHRDLLDVMRWPAAARLSADGDDSMSDLLNEIADGLGSDGRAVLTALAGLDDVDDDIVRAASDGRFGAAGLLGDLPLVQRSDGGSFQIHDLWTRALRGDAAADGLTIASMCRVAHHLLAAGQTLEAAELFASAGDTAGVDLASRTLLAQPLMSVSTSQLRRMARVAREALGEHPVTDLLRATVAEAGDERASADRFEAVARHAAAAGDEEIEALALQNAMNMRTILDPATIGDDLLARADVLAAHGNAMATSVAIVIRSHRARLAGEPEESAAILGQLSGSLSPMIAGSLAFGLSDLGRPEDVPTPSDLDEATTSAAQAGGQALAQAIWLRGDVSPELALELGTQLADVTDVGGVPNQTVSTNAVLALVACAAGHDAAARQFAERATRWSASTASVHVRGLAIVSDAALAVCAGDEAAARAALDKLLAVLPLGNWPPRAYLYSLPMVYALAPQTRPMIERCRFGPAFSAVVAAARALSALREHGDAVPAAMLPWDRPELLRAHVLPPHLTQLAAAAAASGDAEVGTVLDQLPSLRRNLAGAADVGHAATAAWSRARMAALPSRPDFDLRLRVLGTVDLRRGSTAVTDADWSNRDRVRQLFALVVLHRRLPRRRAAELLWPDLTPERAASNLRVNLSHLQRVLQPARPAEERPWFLVADGELLTIAPDGVDVDADRFEAAANAARSLDGAGRVTAALERYTEAAELYRGDYLEEWPPSDWAAVEQRRLRAVALGVFTRLAELGLARGEPERACEWASLALRHEPLHESAARCFARSLAGQGDRAGATRSLRELLERVRDEGLRCEPETIRLAATFGVDVGVSGTG